jgi:hypothetical protein
MTRTLLLASLCIVTLAGCGRTVVRETVVERPVVQREVVVAAPAACTLGGIAHASGTLSCQAGYNYRCNNGLWERIPNSLC